MRECELKRGAAEITLESLERTPEAGCKDETEPRCRICGTPIAARPNALPVCPARTCRRAWLGTDAATVQRSIDGEFRTLVAASASALAEHSPVGGLLPANTRTMAPVTPELRERFVETMRTRLRDYPPEVAPAERRAHRDPVDGSELALHAMLGQACATCGGACCTRGGTHAFLSAAALRGSAMEHTQGDCGAALETLYVANLPATHYAGSCVFHGARGCTLPRTLRSDTCNRYICGELTVLSRMLTGAPGERAVVGAATWSSLERVAVIDATKAHELAVPVAPVGVTPRPTGS